MGSIGGEQGIISIIKLRADETEFKDKPAYFRYLTLVCFHAFMQENVDAVILEVGIGGEYDSTNVIEKPIVCGISSIGIDHVALLGDTKEKIAWHKTGIFKKDCPAVCSPSVETVEQVFRERAVEKQVSSLLILDDNAIKSVPKKLGLPGKHQQFNAALAKSMCQTWLTEMQSRGYGVEYNEEATISGLENAFWPGRCQTVKSENFPETVWHLDGAHTAESLQVGFFKPRFAQNGF
jgi:folylpolyglutamate synthase